MITWSKTLEKIHTILKLYVLQNKHRFYLKIVEILKNISNSSTVIANYQNVNIKSQTRKHYIIGNMRDFLYNS